MEDVHIKILGQATLIKKLKSGLPCLSSPIVGTYIHTYIHTYTLFMLDIYRVAVELIYSRKR